MSDVDTKWLEENDILDRYVLGRLTGEEKARLEALMLADPERRREVEMTAMVAGAIRQRGRADLKGRLRDQIHASDATASVMSFSPGGRSSGRLMTASWIMKAAAVIAIAAGASYLVYRLFFHVPDVEPVVEKKIPSPALEKDKPLPPAKEERMMTFREDSAKAPLAKKSPGKSATTTRPLTLSSPTENAKTKGAQKFKAESILLPKMNDMKLVVVAEDKTESESRLLFKNPVDLTAVDIKEASLEKDGRLEWFYVHYEDRMLSVYLDHSKGPVYFKMPRLEIGASSLVLHTNGHVYSIDLSPKERFHKAVLRP